MSTRCRVRSRLKGSVMFFCNDTALLLLLLLLFSQKEKKNINLICDYASFHIIFLLFCKAKCAIFFFFWKCVAPFEGEFLTQPLFHTERQKQSYDDFRQMMTIIILTIPCSG